MVWNQGSSGDCLRVLYCTYSWVLSVFFSEWPMMALVGCSLIWRKSRAQWWRMHWKSINQTNVCNKRDKAHRQSVQSAVLILLFIYCAKCIVNDASLIAGGNESWVASRHQGWKNPEEKCSRTHFQILSNTASSSWFKIGKKKKNYKLS